jgi:hypothetical protein
MKSIDCKEKRSVGILGLLKEKLKEILEEKN